MWFCTFEIITDFSPKHKSDKIHTKLNTIITGKTYKRKKNKPPQTELVFLLRFKAKLLSILCTNSGLEMK